MNDDSIGETISAALDGERVDLKTLRQALGQPDGRELLASFVLLRAAVAADRVEPGEQLAARQLAVAQRRGVFWVASSSRTRLALAASLAAVAVASSFWLGTRWQGGRLATETAASPTAVSGLDRAGASRHEAGAAPSGGRRAGGNEQPPQPTRVLRFEPGVDWRDGA